jgi:uncharacterized damage-inducible protein DinB
MAGFGAHHDLMPALARPVHDETDALLHFLDQQRDALIASAFGLTEEQATSTPSASANSVAGLIQHLAWGERGWVVGILSQRFDQLPPLPEDDPQLFQVQPGVTVADIVAVYRETAAMTEEIIRALPDLDGEVPLPEAPWFPPDTNVSARWVLLHVIEETARHAGHADIVRESIDGANAYALIDEAEAVLVS